jgi:hypothetical protein
MEKFLRHLGPLAAISLGFEPEIHLFFALGMDT